MATDLSKNSFDQVLDLIRSSNSLSVMALNSSDIDFTSLESLVDHPSGKNTGLVVVSKPNARYRGNVPIIYNRLAVGGLSQYGELTIVVSEGAGGSAILDAINTAYGTNLSADDVELSDTGSVDFDGDIVTITAKANSLAWIGELDLVVKWDQIQLNSILVIAELAGLRWIGAPLLRLDGAYSRLPDLSIDPVAKYQITQLDDVVYFMPTTQRKLYRLDSQTGEIIELAEAPTNTYSDTPGVLHGFDGKLYIANRTLVSTYDIATNTWTGSIPITGRINTGMAMAWKGTKGYLVTANSADLYELDAITGTWTIFETIPASARSAFQCAGLIGNELHLFSRAGGNTTAHWALNLTSKVWTQKANSPRFWIDTNPSIVGDYAYFYGNNSALAPTNTNTLWEYDSINDSWLLVNNGPLLVLSSAQVATNDGMFVIGGAVVGTSNSPAVYKIT